MSGTVPLDHATLTAALARGWDALAALVSGLTEERWRTPSPLPGWTVFDVLAHVVGIESTLLGEPTPAAGTDPRTLPHIRNAVGAMNEAWLESLRPLPGTELLQRFREITTRRSAALAALDDTAWVTPVASPVGEVPYARFMRTRVFDCWMHELDIADALGVTVDEGGPRAELSADELLSYLGRVVVKQGGAPEGSTVAIDLCGPVRRIAYFGVNGGRGQAIPTPDETATATVRLGSGLFARLCGGRTDAASHDDEIELSGDTDLGRRLVTRLAFTI